MTSRLQKQGDDHESHISVAHERHVMHLVAAIDEATAALGWLKAWPNKITNAEEELESVINTLRVARRRAEPEVPDNDDARPLAEPPVYSFDESGDVRK